MIEKLFKEVWHTQETLTTNDNGVVATKGFYGEYEVVIENNGVKKTCKLNISKNSDNKTTIVF